MIDEVRSRFDTACWAEFLHPTSRPSSEMIESVDIFAEVVPEDKYRIVDTLRRPAISSP